MTTVTMNKIIKNFLPLSLKIKKNFKLFVSSNFNSSQMRKMVYKISIYWQFIVWGIEVWSKKIKHIVSCQLKKNWIICDWSAWNVLICIHDIVLIFVRIVTLQWTMLGCGPHILQSSEGTQLSCTEMMYSHQKRYKKWAFNFITSGIFFFVS